MAAYLREIPLAGRILAPARAPNGSSAPRSAPLGFIAGDENRLVASTVGRLMESPAGEYPFTVLSLFGPTGTGKSHLALGLVRYWIERHGSESAAYLTASDFYRHYLDAVKQNAVLDFRRTLRGHELLAIDDLRFLPDNIRVSQELRFALDAYEESGGTIVVTSHRAPNTLANVSSDVRSRLASGLQLQLAPPGTDARVRIIRRVSESLDRPLSDDAANHLARRIPGTASDLFGALFKLCASTANGHDGEALEPERLSALCESKQPELREVLAVVARYYRVPLSQLKSSSRRQSIVAARAMVVYLARDLARTSYEQIGRALGGRDHTTIIHNYRKIERERSREPAVQEAIEELRRILISH